MSTGAIIAIAVVVVVLLGVVFLATTSMRRDRAAAVGVLSRETRKRDRSQAAVEAVAPEEPAPATGREIERAAVLERTSAGTVAIPPRAPPPATAGPIDPETYGQTRRQFLNRGIVGLMVVSLGGFGASVIAFLWPTVSGGFGAKITAGTVDDIEKVLATKQPFYNPQGRFYINPYPTDPATLAKAKKVYSPGLLVGMEAGLRRPVPEVRAPRLPGARGARARSGSSAPATAPSTTGWARRRAVRPPVAWTASP